MFTPDDAKEELFQLREGLKEFEKMTQLLGFLGIGEADANVILAYRHLEDCRMRLGKAIQALNGGISCYPR
jgi:hypothetical protein